MRSGSRRTIQASLTAAASTWPAGFEPSFIGTSIGKWIDEDGDGKYDVLEVETRGFKGPRVYDASGLPLHADNASVIKERIYLDKAKPNLLHDEITTIDPCRDRRGALFPQRRGALDAHQARPGPARFAIFQPVHQIVTLSRTRPG